MTSLWDSLRSSLGGRLARKLPNDFLTARLEKAVEGEICPICTFDGEARHIWLWSFMWENVNDPSTREEFIKTGGLCRADNWSMVEVSRNVIKSTMGVAIVYEHLVNVTARALRRGKSAEPWIDTGRWVFDIGQDCLACSIGRDAVRRGGDRLSLASVVGRRPAWLTKAFPLCHPHLRLLLGEASRPRVRAALVALQKSGIEGMAAKLRSSQPTGWKERGRLEASLFPRGSLFAVPRRSENLYEGAIERCPVCMTMRRRERELLEDGLVARGHEAGQALCLGHYRALVDAHPRLGESALAAGLRDEIGFLEAMASSPATGLGGGATSNSPILQPCAFCRGTRDAEEGILRERVPDWSGGRRPDDLLCLHHLGKALAMIPGREKVKLLSDQVARLGDMLKELRGFIELHDYRSQQQPTENPDAPYRWALRFLTSEPAIVAWMVSTGGSERFLRGRASARTHR